ncbi:MAG: cbb3-type cytochrome c oxidase subunit 3 [Burkholderiales bacterium]|nr:cbb3-type cytochrome c oxidase subunit 3 [Burkholderiales bacterium]MDE2275467.1 cbb3-type cytochrome c oxidase subunit 3 [Burkholderiales bacterium]
MNPYHLHSAATVLGFVFFIGVVAWAWSGRRRADFQEAEQLPFADEPGDRP